MSAGGRRPGRVLLLLWAGLALGCGGDADPAGPDPANGADVVIELRDYEFSQPTVHVNAGETVRWVNTTPTFHTVTPDGHTQWTEWQTASIGQTFDVQFDTPGTYDYHCSPHQSVGMVGTIIVD